MTISGDFDQKYVVENTGSGVAIFDYDKDGLPDIFLVQDDRLKPTEPPLTPHVYHNLGGLRFEDVRRKQESRTPDGVKAYVRVTSTTMDMSISSSGRGAITFFCTT